MLDFLIQQLRQFIFVIAEHGDIVLLGSLGLVTLGFGPIGRGIGARLRRNVDADRRELAAAGMRTEVDELRERLDFSERVVGELRCRLGAAASRTVDEPPDRRELTPV